MADDYHRDPLFDYTPKFTKQDLRYEKPHALTNKSSEGAKVKYNIYVNDGIWDAEYAVIYNYKESIKAVAAFGCGAISGCTTCLVRYSRVLRHGSFALSFSSFAYR